MYSTTYNKEEKVWYGSRIPSIYNPRISLGQVLLNSMRFYGPRVAQISDNNGYRMTYEEMRIKTIRAAQNLQALGCKRKQVIGFIARYSHNLAPVYFASIASGCATTSLDPNFHRSEIVHYLEVTKPNVMCCDVDKYEVLTECFAELGIKAKIFTFDGRVGDSEPVESLFQETHREDQFIPEEVDGPNEAAILVGSSGTTGPMKGIPMSHAAFLDMLGHWHLNECDEVAFHPSPLYWVGTILFLIKGTVSGSTRIITTEPFSPELQLRIMEKYSVTLLHNVPFMIAAMVKSEHFQKAHLPSFKRYFLGGSDLPIKFVNQLKNVFPDVKVINAYGMSEFCGVVSQGPCPTGERVSIGNLLPGLQVKIVDSDGKRCGVNEEGEIRMKKNVPFIGYCGNPKATKEFFDEEGFMKTGDTGNFDEGGNLYYTGRLKDTIKYMGMDVSPAQMDACLCESPHIKEACVVGIPDIANATELPAALVVRSDGSEITEKDVAELITRHFDGDQYKLRGGVFFVDSLPTTHLGKLLRRKALEIVMNLYSSP